jgi:hypothetical protein
MMLLTLDGVAAAVVMSPPTYRSSGSIVLLNPPAAPDFDPNDPTATTVNTENPYVRFNDLSVVVDIVARIVSGETTRAALYEQGVTEYEVAANQNFARGPIIEVTAKEATPAAAIESAQLVLEEVEFVLQERQQVQGTDERYFISIDEVEAPSRATTVLASTLRSAMGALAVGGLLTLSLAVLADVIARRSEFRRRKAPRSTKEQRPSEGPGSNGSHPSKEPADGAGQPAVIRLTPRRVPPATVAAVGQESGGQSLARPTD